MMIMRLLRPSLAAMTNSSRFKYANDSAPCYPAWQISAGKSTEICAIPIINPLSKAGSSGSDRTSEGKSLDTAAIKISVVFYKGGCKPFSYALVFVVFDSRHAFAALRFVSFLSREKKEPFGGVSRGSAMDREKRPL